MQKAELALLKQFGDNLRRIRSSKGMTQERLAELADINVRTVRRLEAAKRKPQIMTLVRLRRALHCTWDDLLPHMPAS